MRSQQSIIAEKAILFSVCKENNATPEKALANYECITDMAEMQKSRSLLNVGVDSKTRTGRKRKDNDFLSVLSARIDLLIEETNG
jgi:hypothetical protein